MKVACLKYWVFILFFITLVTSSCRFMEPISVSNNKNQPAVIQKEHAGYEKIQELSNYVGHVSSLEAEKLEEESIRVSSRFATDPSVANRIRYALLLVYSNDDVSAYKKALSLLSDAQVADDESEVVWQFYVDNFIYMLDKNLELQDRGQRLLNEREKILSEKELLRKKLKSKQAELTKLQSQLDELKSIEKSILERDIVEDVGKP